MNLSTARKLYERRYRTSPVITTGELLNLIGSDGLSEALLQRWLVPLDDASGYLRLNTDGGKLNELAEACRCQCGSLACTCQNTDPVVSTVMPMRESFAAFGVARPGGSGASPTGTPAPALPLPRRQAASAPTTTADASKPARIGDQATVTDAGKAYTGRIASIGQDGRMRLSFGSEKPSMDREYGADEMNVQPETGQPAAP